MKNSQTTPTDSDLVGHYTRLFLNSLITGPAINGLYREISRNASEKSPTKSF